MHEFGVLIGRFQPFHNAHLETVRFALAHARHVIIVIGSANQAPDVRDPWSEQQRKEMIRACLRDDEWIRIHVLYVEDQPYDDALWAATVQNVVGNVVGDSTDVKLIGHHKDASSFYLRLFPSWGEHLETGIRMDVDATGVRERIFRQDRISMKSMVPPETFPLLERWCSSREYARLYYEFQEVEASHEAWRGAPKDPIFMMTDAVVVCSGHVLVVERAGRYGQGLTALPGGHVEPQLRLLDNCIKELVEETCINLDDAELRRALRGSGTFDHPRRDLRGRSITKAFFFRLPNVVLPRVQGADDAHRAWWMQLAHVDASRRSFFSDHLHIIKRFTSRS